MIKQPSHSWLGRLALGPAALALLLSLGCAKMSDSHAYLEAPAAMPAAQTIDVTGSMSMDRDYDGVYDFSDDLAEGEMFAPEGAVIASRARATMGEAREWGPPVRNQPGEPSVTEPRAGTGEPAVAGKDDQTPDHGRQIIYVAGMQISVYNLESAMTTVEALPDRFGGWIHMRNQSQVVLRLPADRLKPAMAELATFGVVEARTLQAQDVTAEYVDLESRIKVLRETQTQLLDLLGKAKTVEEALHVRRALDQVTMELEVALGRMRQLSDLIAYSTLTVTLVERGPQDHMPTSNDPFGWVDTLGVEATEWR
ncbi:MAG TPA: DUF4349 domain-containing protein [Enhygromyxa sp.]|nr:DUF4349 domain-containing protein [Enhygromyxa sp.]